MRRSAIALFLVSSSWVFAAAQALDEGEIGGAKFAIVLPAQWNRQLILVAPGLHPENEPLAAAFSPEDAAYRTLFNEGWMVAKTSFRRNGIILADAIADLDALRDYVVTKYGKPVRTFVVGESLGGLVAVLVAEREPAQPLLYDGVLAIGPALSLRETPATLGLSLHPKIPILFLANQGDLEGPRGYIASPFARELDRVPPVLFRISRGGYANVNQRERLTALRVLNAWVARGPTALPQPASGTPFFDATVPPEPKPSAVLVHGEGHGFDAHVTGFAPSQGALFLDAQPADFASADIKPSTWFRLTVRDRVYRTYYGREFYNVKRGEWVVIPGAEGNFILARLLGDAATTASLAPGDVVSIQRYESAN